MRFKIGLIIAAAIGLSLFLRAPLRAENPAAQRAELLFFFSPSCRECTETIQKVIPGLRDKFSGSLDIRQRDISDIENYKYYLSLKQSYPDSGLKDKWPVFFMNGMFWSEEKRDKQPVEAFIQQALNPVKTMSAAQAQRVKVDIKSNFSGFRTATVIAAGLVDGINPCAFTVIVFFISFLALQGYSRKELILVGTVFIFAVFCAYLFIGLGVFGVLYRMRNFWFFTGILNMVIGIFSLLVGVIALYDVFVFYAKGSNEKMLLRLPAAVKARIQGVIGAAYRRGKPAAQTQNRPHNLFSLSLTAFGTGFLVSVLESVCTGQMYLPTIVFVLKSAEFRLKAVAYLLLYNLMFILPLALILFLALAGVTSARLTAFFSRKVGLVKMSMAVIFFIMGIVLIRRV